MVDTGLRTPRPWMISQLTARRIKQGKGFLPFIGTASHPFPLVIYSHKLQRFLRHLQIMIGKWWFDVVCMEWEMDHNMPRQVHQKATHKTMCPWKSGRPKTLIMGITKFLTEILHGGSTGPAWHEIAWAVVVLCCFVHIQYCWWLLSPSVHRPLSLVWSAWHFNRRLPFRWLYQPWLSDYADTRRQNLYFFLICVLWHVRTVCY